jgi:hypothetical protein
MFNIIRYIFISFILVTGLYGCGASTESTTKAGDSTSSTAAVKLNGQMEKVNDDVKIKLSWTSENIDFCIASGAWSGEKSISGEEIILNPGQNKKYEISCATALDTQVTDVIDFTDSTVVPTLELTASQGTVEYGGSTELSWSAENVDVCVASGGWTGNQSLNGTLNLQNLVEDQVYTLTCSGDYGLISEFVTIQVDDPVVVEEPPVLTFTASSSQVAENTSFTLNWSSSYASGCQASGAWSGARDTSGSEVIPFINTSSHFVLQCDGPGGSINRAVDVVLELTSAAPQLSFTATSEIVSQNGSTTLQWTATDADSCEASGDNVDWSGTKSTSGSATITNLQQTSVFSLTCSGAGGTVSDSVSVTVETNSTGTALLSWTPPTQNTDGTALTDLAGYKIYYGTESGNYTEVVTLNDPGVPSHQIDNLSSGEWFFVMTSFNSQNIESSYSNEASKIIN